jgi:hypothetical protein
MCRGMETVVAHGVAITGKRLHRINPETGVGTTYVCVVLDGVKLSERTESLGTVGTVGTEECMARSPKHACTECGCNVRRRPITLDGLCERCAAPVWVDVIKRAFPHTVFQISNKLMVWEVLNGRGKMGNPHHGRWMTAAMEANGWSRTDKGSPWVRSAEIPVKWGHGTKIVKGEEYRQHLEKLKTFVKGMEGNGTRSERDEDG